MLVNDGGDPDFAVKIKIVDDIREPFDGALSISVRGACRKQMRVPTDPSGHVLDVFPKVNAQAIPLAFVVGDCRRQFGFGFRVESDRLHGNLARNSAKT